MNLIIKRGMSLQVVLSASVGRGFQGDIAVDDVTFMDGLCESGSESRGWIGTSITNPGLKLTGIYLAHIKKLILSVLALSCLFCYVPFMTQNNFRSKLV